MAPPKTGEITPAQIVVLRLLAEGGTNKSVAKELGVSDFTVDGHVKNLMRRLHAKTRTQAMYIAVRRGYVEEEPGQNSGHRGDKD